MIVYSIGPKYDWSGPKHVVSIGPKCDWLPEVEVLTPNGVGSSGILGPNGVGPSGMLGTIKMHAGRLNKVYPTWEQTCLVSLEHSTKVGCSAMLDAKESGGRRKMLRWRTPLSKKKERNADVPDGRICKHMLLGTRNRTGDWKLDLKKNQYRPHPFLHFRPDCNPISATPRSEICQIPEFGQAIYRHSCSNTGPWIQRQNLILCLGSYGLSCAQHSEALQQNWLRR